MEKRAVVAFALSLLVLFLWEIFFGSLRHTPPQAPEEMPPISQTAPTPSEPGPSPAGAPPAPESLPGGRAATPTHEAKGWKVQASLFSMDISGAGARIQGIQLDKYKEQAGSESPPMELIPSRTTGYLPLSVDLIQHPDWQLSTRQYVSDSPESVQASSHEAPKSVAVSTEVPGQVRVTKIFSFVPDSYIVNVDIQLQNLSSQSLSDQLAVSFYYEPYDGQPESSYNQSYLSVFQNGKVSKYQVKDLAKKSLAILAPYEWVGYENNYFLSAFIPTEEGGSQVVPKILDADKGLIQTVFLSAPFQLEGGRQKNLKMRLYVGPKELDRLEQAGSNLVSSVEYGWFGFVARPLLYVLKWLYKYVHNYGVAIIVLTVIIKILFWPLTQKSYKSMQAMKKLQPKISQIREKYKNDREKMNQELMMVYRTYKVNPLGGCLPMVLQIPVFFALYRMLSNSVELLHQPFALWIHDLTAPDRLHIGIPIPYLGGIPVLTILMGVTMFIQQKMTPSAGDPRQEQIMLLMPVMFTFFFINFPAGLVLYWFVNNVLSIAQQYWVNRQAST